MWPACASTTLYTTSTTASPRPVPTIDMTACNDSVDRHGTSNNMWDADAALLRASPLPQLAGAAPGAPTAQSSPLEPASCFNNPFLEHLRSPLQVHPWPNSPLGSVALPIMGHGISATTHSPIVGLRCAFRRQLCWVTQCCRLQSPRVMGHLDLRHARLVSSRLISSRLVSSRLGHVGHSHSTIFRPNP